MVADVRRHGAPTGTGLTKLWFAPAVSDSGDGITTAAGPLPLASLTDDPALVAGAVFAQQLPRLPFSPVSGATGWTGGSRPWRRTRPAARSWPGRARRPGRGTCRCPSPTPACSCPVVGGSALGALVGGPPARRFGITTPFWFAVVVVAGVAAVAWRPFAAATDLHRSAAAAT
ncbi:hypothetical protein AB0H12_35395 [Actinosynnema sp. NPDC023794]